MQPNTFAQSNFTAHFLPLHSNFLTTFAFILQSANFALTCEQSLSQNFTIDRYCMYAKIQLYIYVCILLLLPSISLLPHIQHALLRIFTCDCNMHQIVTRALIYTYIRKYTHTQLYMPYILMLIQLLVIFSAFIRICYCLLCYYWLH